MNVLFQPMTKVAFPKVRVNEEVQVAGKKCHLRKTDYYYMTFSGKLTNTKKEPNVAFTYKDLPIQLTLCPMILIETNRFIELPI